MNSLGLLAILLSFFSESTKNLEVSSKNPLEIRSKWLSRVADNLSPLKNDLNSPRNIERISRQRLKMILMDSILKISWSASPGSKTSVEMYCHPASLVKQLASYERWALIIELFLGLNAAVVCAMLAYMMCQGSAGSLGSLCSLVGLFPFKRAPFILICYTFLFEKIIFSLYSLKILLRGSLGFYLVIL